MTTKMYAIKNCNTVKKAMDHLKEKGVDYEFNDFKKQPATEDQLRGWIKESSWETVFKKRGMMWNKLTPEQKESLNEENAVALMLENNSRINRPVVVLNNGKTLFGFNEEEYNSNF